MEYLNKILVFLASLSLAYSYIPSLYYLNERCNFGLSFSNDVRIKLTRYPYTYLKRGMDCRVTVTSYKSSDNLLVRFRSLDTQNSGNCNRNSLRLIDSNGQEMTGANGLCGRIRPSKLYETHSNTISLEFQTDTFTSQTGNFELLITSFHYGTQNGTCNAGDYKCSNKKCIYNGLTCDGYNNCGDDSDEVDGCGLSTGVLTGIGIAAVVFFILIILGVIFGRRRYYHHHDCHGGTTVTTTTTRSYQNF